MELGLGEEQPLGVPLGSLEGLNVPVPLGRRHQGWDVTQPRLRRDPRRGWSAQDEGERGVLLLLPHSQIPLFPHLPTLLFPCFVSPPGAASR